MIQNYSVCSKKYSKAEIESIEQRKAWLNQPSNMGNTPNYSINGWNYDESDVETEMRTSPPP